MKKYNEAIEDAEKAISINPALDEGYSKKGAALKCQSHWREAKATFLEGLKHNPDSEKLLGDLEEFKNMVLAINEQGSEAFKLGNLKEAMDFFTEAIRMDPSIGQLYSNRSKVHEFQGNYYEKLEDANNSIRLLPSEDGYLQKGNALELLHRCLEAVTTYKEGLELNPNSQQLKEALTRCKNKEWPLCNKQGQAKVTDVSSSESGAIGGGDEDVKKRARENREREMFKMDEGKQRHEEEMQKLKKEGASHQENQNKTSLDLQKKKIEREKRVKLRDQEKEIEKEKVKKERKIYEQRARAAEEENQKLKLDTKASLEADRQNFTSSINHMENTHKMDTNMIKGLAGATAYLFKEMGFVSDTHEKNETQGVRLCELENTSTSQEINNIQDGDKDALLLAAVEKSDMATVSRLVKCVDGFDPDQLGIAYEVAQEIGQTTIIKLIGHAMKKIEQKK